MYYIIISLPCAEEAVFSMKLVDVAHGEDALSDFHKMELENFWTCIINWAEIQSWFRALSKYDCFYMVFMQLSKSVLKNILIKLYGFRMGFVFPILYL